MGDREREQVVMVSSPPWVDSSGIVDCTWKPPALAYFGIRFEPNYVHEQWRELRGSIQLKDYSLLSGLRYYPNRGFSISHYSSVGSSPQSGGGRESDGWSGGKTKGTSGGETVGSGVLRIASLVLK